MAKYPTSDGWCQIDITAQAVEVTADLSNFVVYFDLSLLPGEFWDNIEDGGGSIRVLKDDLDTEIAREVVSCDKTAQIGEVHARADGTLSAASDTKFWFAFGKDSETDYAVDATFGQYAVWQGIGSGGHDFLLVSHDGGATDSTSYQRNPVDSQTQSLGGATGKIGAASEFSPEDFIELPELPLSDADNAVFSAWHYPITLGNYGRIIDSPHELDFAVDAGQGNAYLLEVDGTNRWFGDSPIATGTWHLAAGFVEGTSTNVCENGTLYSWGTGGNYTANAYNCYIGNRIGQDRGYDGYLDEVRVLKGEHGSSRDAFFATEYNNQSDPAAFWVVGDVVAPAVVLGYKYKTPISTQFGSSLKSRRLNSRHQ